jgi:transposase
MLRIALNPEQQAEVQALRHDRSLSSCERDRLEMVALSAAGWSVTAIAAHLGRHPETVRRLFRRIPTEGLAAVRQDQPGPPADRERRQAVEAELQELLSQERTWTSAQLAEALVERGIHLSGRHVRRYVHRLGAGWRRTKRSLAHQQDPVAKQRASATLALLANGRGRAD